MKIIIITYPVSPFRGSEYSVSWNYITEMSKYHELFVLYGTSGNGLGNVSELQEWLKNNELKNVHFINVQMPKNKLSYFLAFCRKLNYTYGSFIQYKYWHKFVYQKAKEIITTNNIQIIHYLNPIGFKEPSECWRIKDIPYIWGPMKATSNTSFKLYKALSLKGKVSFFMKRILHNIAFITFPKVRKAIKRADFIFSATPETVIMLKKWHHKESLYLPENGIKKMERNLPIKYDPTNTPLNIVWIGRLDENKALIILLDALKKVKSQQWHLHVIGSGELEDKLKRHSMGFSSFITWYGNIPRTKVLQLLSTMHLHVITSLSEATSTVLLEAMSFAIPTITLDHCGMSAVVCPKCGIKISIQSYKQITEDIAYNIDLIIKKPQIIQSLSEGVLECSKKFMWSNRIKIFNEIYNQIVKR